MNSNILASIVVLSMFLISSMMYQHKGRRYAEGKTEKISSAREFSLVYRYLQISTLVITLLAFNSDASWLLEVHHSEVVRFIGLAAAGMAIAVFLGAKVSLGRHYSPCFDSFVPQDIVQDGIYNYIRHPIYTSNIFLLFSIFVATGSIWLLVNAMVLWAYYHKSAYIEEAALSEKFPKYIEYIARTGRFFPQIK